MGRRLKPVGWLVTGLGYGYGQDFGQVEELGLKKT